MNEVSILILLDYLFLFSLTMLEEKQEKQGFNPYFTGLPILIQKLPLYPLYQIHVSILILLDYLFLYIQQNTQGISHQRVSILILLDYLFLYEKSALLCRIDESFNPYFTGLPILIKELAVITGKRHDKFQSLFYWITYSYLIGNTPQSLLLKDVSILILLDYLFL